MNTIRIISFLFAITVSAFSFTQNALAEPEKPLIIVRFNHSYVNYQHPLQMAVKSALDAKESAFFDIVSIIPGEKDSDLSKHFKKPSTLHTAKIINSIKKYGVDPQKIRVSYQNSTLAQNNEVHVFVR